MASGKQQPHITKVQDTELSEDLAKGWLGGPDCTAILSSAAVQHLFSIGKDIFTAKTAILLSDANVRLTFIKVNQHQVEVTEKAGGQTTVSAWIVKVTVMQIFYLFFISLMCFVL